MKTFTLILVLMLTAVTVVAQDFYVFAGQSNMSGNGKSEDLCLKDLDTENMWGWDWVQNKFVTDLNPLENDDVFRAETLHGFPFDRTGYWGPELEALRVIRDKTNRPVYFIKYGWGGSSLLPDHQGLNNWQNNLYDTLKGEIDLIARTPTAFLWMQGETETITTARAGQYYGLLSDFIDRVKSEICSGLFIAGQVSFRFADAIGTQEAIDGNAIVQQAQLDLNQENKLKLVGTDDLVKYRDDLGHFNAESLRMLGFKFALQALYGHTTNNSHSYPEVVGDYDNDGNTDALWSMRSGVNKIFKIWLMNSSHAVTGQYNLYWNGDVMDRISTDFKFINSVDVDNDGADDIYHTDGETRHIWRIDWPNVTHSKWTKE